MPSRVHEPSCDRAPRRAGGRRRCARDRLRARRYTGQRRRQPELEPPKQESTWACRRPMCRPRFSAGSPRAPPAPVTADQWKHVKQLYAAFDQNLLWLDDKGVHQPRVAALLNCARRRRQRRVRLDAFPLADLSRALARGRQRASHGRAARRCGRAAVGGVRRASARTCSPGNRSRSSLGQSWHINRWRSTSTARSRSRFAKTILAAGWRECGRRIRAYDSLRTEFSEFRDVVANGGWPSDSIAHGRQLQRGDRIRPRGSTRCARGFAPKATRSDSASADPGVYDARSPARWPTFRRATRLASTACSARRRSTALNVPLNYRLAQIAANLERLSLDAAVRSAADTSSSTCRSFN